MANEALAQEIVNSVKPRYSGFMTSRAETMLVEGLARLDLERLNDTVSVEDRTAAIESMGRSLSDSGYWDPGNATDPQVVARALRAVGEAIARDPAISNVAKGAISRDCLYCGYQVIGAE